MSLFDDISGSVSNSISNIGSSLPGVATNLLNGFGNQLGGLATSEINGLLNKADTTVSNFINKITGAPQPDFSFLNQALSRPDPHLTYQWTIQMTGFGIDYGKYVEEVSCSVGSITVDSPIFMAGEYVNSPGEYKLSTLELTMYEDRQLASTAFVTKWMRDFYNPNTGVYNYLNAAKRTIVLTLCDGAYQKIATFTYQGCMPSDKSPLSLTSDQGRSTVKFTVHAEREQVKIYQYAIDGMTFQFLGSNNPISSAISGLVSGVPQAIGSLFS